MQREDDPARSATLPIGSVLRGKYRIDRVLGAGGMAVVYATTHRNSRRFAIKLLRAELAARSWVSQRFVREGYLANSVEHAGVVAVLDDDVTEDGAPFLVMELLEGASLDALTEAFGRLSTGAVLALADQLLDVLKSAHARGVIHRDIKPSNLFLCRDGTLKLLDFGIARLGDATRNPSATSTGAILGTPAFMAPEQALADSRAIDARTDLWAVGATLFTLLSGQQVHAGESPQHVVVRVASEPARSLGTVAVDTPRGVVELVDRALAFERDARWESAQAMQDAVRAVHEELYGTREFESLLPVLEASVARVENAPTEQSPSEEPRRLSEGRAARSRAWTRRALLAFTGLAAVLGLWLAGRRLRVSLDRKEARPPAAAVPASRATRAAALPSRTPAPPPLRGPVTDPNSQVPVRPASSRRNRTDLPPAPRRNPLDLEIQ